MPRAKRTITLESIKRKYARKVRKTYNLYQDKTWGEFMQACDILKERMAEEIAELESQGHKVDSENAGGDERQLASNIPTGDNGVQ